MVYLNRIYTKTGDDGETSLGDGSRVHKTSLRIRAYGGVDELNSFLGVCLATAESVQLRQQLRHIQNDLFDLGADLCVPLPPENSPAPDASLRIQAHQVETLERWIDAAVDKLQPLTSFILPGGAPLAAALHVARAVCRRVELDVIALAETEQLSEPSIIYLNRLSDLLFVWARSANDEGRADVLWTPGKHREQASESPPPA